MVEKEDIVNALKEVIDPHTGTSVYDMGLIKDIVVEDSEVSLTFVPSSPFCPLGVQLSTQIKDKVKGIEGVEKTNIKVEGHIQEEELTKKLCD